MFNEKSIIVDLISKENRNRPGYAMKPEYITVHDTGNENASADALMHAKYIKNPSTAASWHFTVDDKRIVQHLPLDENGWHAGDGNNGAGNRRSIGIEICMNKGIDRVKAEANAAELIAYLMKKLNIPLEKIVQHNNWSGKNCPQLLRSRPKGWENFIEAIKNNLEPKQANENSVPEWQLAALKDLIRKGIINTPEYWENRLLDNVTIGEMMVVINNLS